MQPGASRLPAHRHPCFFEREAMTDHIDRSHTHQHEGSSQETREEHLTIPVETQMAVQQVREAGFSEDQQAALT